MKPVIGITCSIHVTSTGTLTFAPMESQVLGETYTNAVERAGGIPVILPNYLKPELMREIAGRLDGVIFSGGPDVDPALYGQRIIQSVGPVTVRRDASELELARYVLNETKMPVLGICRGIQLLNVAAGGTLIQDLQTAGKDKHNLSVFPRYYESHKVYVEAGSRLEKIVGSTVAGVNSFHHQAVLDVAPGWKCVATADSDQIIEAIELPGERFALGVQWHPECLVETDSAKAIFDALIQAADAYKSNT